MKMLDFKLFVMRILFRKEEKTLAEVYATLIVKGLKTFAEVPSTMQAKVKDVLVGLDMGELAE